MYSNLSKAFDTLNHSILLEKLEYYGIANNSLSLLHNYLTDRCQCVDIMATDQIPYPYLLVSHRARFWDHCCFLYTSMI